MTVNLSGRGFSGRPESEDDAKFRKQYFIDNFVIAARIWFKDKDPTEADLIYRIGWLSCLFHETAQAGGVFAIRPEEVPEIIEALGWRLGGPTDTENR